MFFDVMIFMYTEVRVGEYSGDIKDILSKHYSTFIKIDGFRSDVDKYGLKEEKGLMVISQSKGIRNEDYNVILTCHSKDKEKAKKQADTFEEKTSLKLRDAPDNLKKLFKVMDDTFSSVEDMMKLEF